MILKDHTNVPAVEGDLASTELVQVLPFNHHLAAAGPFNKSDQFEEGGFTGTRMTGKKGHLAGRQMKTHVS